METIENNKKNNLGQETIKISKQKQTELKEHLKTINKNLDEWTMKKIKGKNTNLVKNDV